MLCGLQGRTTKNTTVVTTKLVSVMTNVVAFVADRVGCRRVTSSLSKCKECMCGDELSGTRINVCIKVVLFLINMVTLV